MTTAETSEAETSEAETSQAAMIYGAYGYTGELAVRQVAGSGLTVVLAGRNADKLAAVAERWAPDLERRVFSLDDPAALDEGLRGIGVVLHCAGPFSATSEPMVAACQRTGAHYLDITGEIGVFERLAHRGAEAEAAGIMTLPGIGFDVVPTDCVAARLAEELPSATHLELAFASLHGGSSQGTLKTAVEGLDQGGAVRRDGRIVKVRNAYMSKTVEFAPGVQRTVVSIPWGDVSTAYASTGIPNITCFMAASPGMVRGMKISQLVRPLLGLGLVKIALRRRIESGPAGPSDERRAKGVTYVWGAAWDNSGARVEVRLKTVEGYTLTAVSGLLAAKKVLAGDWKPGFQTPSSAYGWRYVEEIDGSEWL